LHSDPCSIWLISGFLGSGKTTLLAHILSWPKLSRTAVLVNEFGSVGIDGELLQGYGAPVVEMANGCICCSLQADFRRSLESILVRFGPSRILIEATGVADPQDIRSILNEAQFKDRLHLSKTVTVIDTDFWEGREHLGPLFFNQIRAADLILLNKIDQHPVERVTEFISEIRQACPSSSIVPTCFCQIDEDAFWEFREESEDPEISLLPMYLGKGPERSGESNSTEPGAREQGFVNFSYVSSARFSEERFRSFLASAPAHLYRIKGYVFLGNRWVFINHVGGKTEWVDSSEHNSSRLAFVGWQVDKEALLARLEECLVDSD
jgi:G3E family GTPase